jgi:hypothetical protein
MKIARGTTGWLSTLLAAAVLAVTAQDASAQTTNMPSTLRYGSGYMDVPSATVLPHLAIQGTFSGFWVNLDRTLVSSPSGAIIGTGPAIDQFYADGSVTLGLFDRLEVGASLQSFNDADQGGNMWGAFGRLAILRPADQGLGLAAGARYVTAPSYDDDINYAPTRLGFPDRRARETFVGNDVEMNSELSLYGVASVALRGFDSSWFPEHDWTLSLGWGNGMFNEGEELEWYRFADSEGVFAGAVMHMGVGDEKLLNLMGEWNGFDLNFGAQLDLGGLRVGGHYLGANYLKDISSYRSPKFGFLVSTALCPGDGMLCKPGLMERAAPDTVRLPAPPPDTVEVVREVEPELPSGNPAQVCLATGQNVDVLLTAQGDTLVGPARTSISELRPGVVFAGTYADGREWFTNDESIRFEDRSYDKSGDEVSMTCADIMRVGEHMGVPLFAMRNAERPYETLYVPVRPGVWQAYQTGLQQTRGQ